LEPHDGDARGGRLKHVKAKVCLVGDVAVGKTLRLEIRRFVQDEFDDRYIATSDQVTKRTVDVSWKGAPAMLDMMVWDIMARKDSGPPRMRTSKDPTASSPCATSRGGHLLRLEQLGPDDSKAGRDRPDRVPGKQDDLGERLVVSEEELARNGHDP